METRFGFTFVRKFLHFFMFTFALMLGVVLLVAFLFSRDTTVEAVGMVEPRNTTFIRSPITGIIKTILVESGQTVQEGEALLALADEEIQADLRKTQRDLEIAQADLAQATSELRVTETRTGNKIGEMKANLSLARADLERITRQFELSRSVYQEMASESDRSNPERVSQKDFSEVKMKEAQVRRAQAQLKSAQGEIAQVGMIRAKMQSIERRIRKFEEQVAFYQDRLSKTRIHAPVSGTVLTFDLDRKIGSRVLEGETVLRIGDLSDWVVRAFLTEENIPRVRPGQRAKITLKAFPYVEYRIFEGQVEQIPFSPLLDEKGEILKDKAGRIFYPVIVRIDDPIITKGDQKFSFQYGLGAKVKIILRRERIYRLLYERFLKVK